MFFRGKRKVSQKNQIILWHLLQCREYFFCEPWKKCHENFHDNLIKCSTSQIIYSWNMNQSFIRTTNILLIPIWIKVHENIKLEYYFQSHFLKRKRIEENTRRKTLNFQSIIYRVVFTINKFCLGSWKSKYCSESYLRFFFFFLG